MSARLIAITPDAEKIMGYIARVSNPLNQDNENVVGLLTYCLKHGHFSVFEHANLTIEIETTRDIAAQILRHRSFVFQEFSQRYAAVTDVAELPELRMQDHKNRQNSLEPSEESAFMISEFTMRIMDHFNKAKDLYDEMLAAGIAKECARKVLPLNTKTKLYMTGNVRNWIHYINLRTANGTQKEHMLIAEQVKQVFTDNLPIISQALGWTVSSN